MALILKSDLVDLKIRTLELHANNKKKKNAPKITKKWEETVIRRFDQRFGFPIVQRMLLSNEPERWDRDEYDPDKDADYLTIARVYLVHSVIKFDGRGARKKIRYVERHMSSDGQTIFPARPKFFLKAGREGADDENKSRTGATSPSGQGSDEEIEAFRRSSAQYTRKKWPKSRRSKHSPEIQWRKAAKAKMVRRAEAHAFLNSRQWVEGKAAYQVWRKHTKAW